MSSDASPVSALTLEDRWILSRLNDTTARVTAQLEEFKFSEPMGVLYRFFWNELCDWYLELIKPRMRDEARKAGAQQVLAWVLDMTLRLLHPFMPFITEGIYQQLNQHCPQRGLPGGLPGGRKSPPGKAAEANSGAQVSPVVATAVWPEAQESRKDVAAETQMKWVQEVIRLLRDLRTRYRIAPKEPLEVSIKAEAEVAQVLIEQERLLTDLCRLKSLQAGAAVAKPRDAAVAVGDNVEVYVQGVVDTVAERQRLSKQQAELQGRMRGVEAKLQNENFVNRAKPEVVQRERQRYEQLQGQLAVVEKNLAALSQ